MIILFRVRLLLPHRLGKWSQVPQGLACGRSEEQSRTPWDSRKIPTWVSAVCQGRSVPAAGLTIPSKQNLGPTWLKRFGEAHRARPWATPPGRGRRRWGGAGARGLGTGRLLSARAGCGGHGWGPPRALRDAMRARRPPWTSVKRAPLTPPPAPWAGTQPRGTGPGVTSVVSRSWDGSHSSGGSEGTRTPPEVSCW